MTSDLSLSRADLEKLDKEDLIRLANQMKKHEEALQYAKGDIYLENAHEGQLDFHKANNRVRVVFGGNRSGKSTAGVNEARWLAEGSHPFRPYRTPTKGCIVCQDFQTHATDVIVPKIHEWFPPGLIQSIDKNQSGTPVKFHLRNGSTIDIKSHDQDIKVFEGSDYDWIWFDEPPPKAIYQALWRGLTDRRGIAYITGTPITEPWLADVYAKAVAEENKGMYWATFMNTDLNATNLGEGNREEGLKRIEEFLDAFDDPDEKETRRSGKLLHMRGLIFKSWNRKKHLIPSFAWPSQWPILISLDPHPRKDWGLSYLGLTPSGTKILLASYLVPGVVSDVAQFTLWALNEIEIDGPARARPKVLSCWIDNYASVDSMIKKTTIVDELNSLVVPTIPRFQPAPKDVNEKITIFRGWLKEEEDKYGKRPKFLAFDIPENKDFIREIEHYVWQTHRGARRKELKNVPVKDNDDILDSIMQLALVLDSKKGQAGEKKPEIGSYLSSRRA